MKKMIHNTNTLIKNKQEILNNITEDVKPVVKERWNLLNNVNYYMNIKQFYKYYIIIYILIILVTLFIANKWVTIIYVTCYTLVIYAIIWIINLFVAKYNTTKHIPEIIKENFDINQNTDIYIDKYNCVCQAPSEDNPFMNVLLSDYEDNPYRPKACDPSDPVIEDKINKFFYSNPAFINPRDIYQTHNDQHQWYTQPGSTIPYDREGWMEDAYRDMTSCKSDMKFCDNHNWDLRRP